MNIHTSLLTALRQKKTPSKKLYEAKQKMKSNKVLQADDSQNAISLNNFNMSRYDAVNSQISLGKKFLCSFVAIALVIGFIPVQALGTPAEINPKQTISTKAESLQVKQFVAADRTSAAVTTDGQLYVWGSNDWGIAGNGTRGTSNDGLIEVPQKVPLDNVDKIAVSGSSIAAITTDGTLYIWGYIEDGSYDTGEGYTLEPVKAMSDVVQVDVDSDTFAAVTSDGSLWMWGHNGSGIVANGQGQGSPYVPIEDRVKVLDNVAQVDIEAWLGAALKANGEVYIWGPNSENFIGSNTYTPKYWMSDVSQIENSGAGLGLVKNDNTLWMVGDNYYGSLGDGTLNEGTNEPVKVLDYVSQVSRGNYNSAAVSIDGLLYAWGGNEYNHLSGMDKIDGEIVTPTRVQDDVKQVSLSGAHGGFIKSDGSLWLWGQNEFGQLGYDTNDGGVDARPTNNTPHEVLTTMHPDESDESPNPDSPASATSNTENISNCDYTIGSEIDFTVPKKVPLIGGGKFNIDLGNVPVQMQREGNTYRFGFGVDDINELIESGGWQTFKKFVETQKQSLATGLNGLNVAKSYHTTVSKGFSVDPDMSIWGYAEGTVDSSGVHSIAGRLSIAMSAKGTQEWQTIVVVVPVVVTFKGEVGFEADVALGLDTDRSEFYIDGSLDLTLPKVKLTGGVGIAWVADIGVYGSARNGILLEGGRDNAITASLEGELGARARALCFEYEKAFLEGEWKYLELEKSTKTATPQAVSTSENNQVNTTSNNLSADMETFSLFGTSENQDVELSNPYSDQSEGEGWFGIDRSNASKWYSEQDPIASFFSFFSGESKSASAGELETLQESVYTGAQPQLVQTESGTKVLVFTQDLSERTSANHTAVSYSVFNEEEGTWGSPVVVNDDGTADFEPSVAVNGNEVWISWSNASRIFSEEELAEENFPATLAASCDIVTAKIDPVSGAIETKQITKDEAYDSKPSIAVMGGSPMVSWVTSTGNDPFTMSGLNIINFASASEDMPNAETIYRTENAIASLEAGYLDEKPTVSFVIDNGDGVQASEKMNLMLWQEGSEPKTIEEGAVNPVFTTVAGEKALVWYVAGEEGNSLRYVNSAEAESVDLIKNSTSLAADYSISENNGTQLILSSEAKPEEDQDGTNVVAYLVSNGVVSNPVTLTNVSGYTSCATSLPQGNNWNVVLLRSDVAVEEDRVLQDADLCSLIVEPKASLSLQNPSVDEDSVSPGNQILLTVEAINNGLSTSASESISVMRGEEVLGTGQSGELAPGQQTELQIPVTLPDDLSMNTELTVMVNGESSDNQCGLTIGKTNLALEAKLVTDGGITESITGITAKVENTSGFTTSAKVEVRANDEHGEVLAEKSLGEIASGTAQELSFTADEVAQFGCESVYITIVSDDSETYYSDNSTLVYTGSDILKNLDTITVELPTSEFDLATGVDLSVMVVTANYTDGTKMQVDSYTTNLSSLDVLTPGEKTLTVAYEEAGQGRSVNIPIKLMGSHAHASENSHYTINTDTEEISYTCSQCGEDVSYDVTVVPLESYDNEMKMLQNALSDNDTVIAAEKVSLKSKDAQNEENEGNTVWTLDKPLEIVIPVVDAADGDEVSIYALASDGSVAPLGDPLLVTNGCVTFESPSAGSFAVVKASNPEECTVTFDSRGGNGGGTQTVTSGETVSDPGNPTREGYTFIGWFVEPECTTYFNFSDLVTESMTIYAGWQKNMDPDPDAGTDPNEPGTDPDPDPEPDIETIPLPEIVGENGSVLEVSGLPEGEVLLEAAFTVEGGTFNSETGKIIVPSKEGVAPERAELTLEDTNNNSVADKLVIAAIYPEEPEEGTGVDSDGDGIPDKEDPYPNDPDHDKDGVIDGEDSDFTSDDSGESGDSEPGDIENGEQNGSSESNSNSSDNTDTNNKTANEKAVQTSDDFIPFTVLTASLVLISLIGIFVSLRMRRHH